MEIQVIKKRDFNPTFLAFFWLLAHSCRKSATTTDSELNQKTGTASANSLETTIIHSQLPMDRVFERLPVPDCWDSPTTTAEKRIFLKYNTKVLVDPNSETSVKDAPYFMYHITGPALLMSSSQVLKRGFLGDSKLTEKFQSCWIESKYIDLNRLKNGAASKTLEHEKKSGVVTLITDFSYFKKSISLVAELLTPVPTPSENFSKVHVSQLRSLLHFPDSACLLPKGSKIAFNQAGRQADSTLKLENGHVFLSFSVQTLVGSQPSGIEFGGGEGYHKPYYSEKPYLDHWKQLQMLYPNHPFLKAESLKTGLACELREGWIFKEHFEGW